ncbi:MAG: Gx transporter family protein, partial [Floccifex sp.]
KEMFIVNFFRVIISSLMTGIFMSYPFFISCGGVLLSSIALAILKKLTDLPVVSTSVIAAVFHNIGQVLVVAYLLSSQAIMSYVFILLASSIPTGIFTGLTAIEILKRVKK